MEKIEIGILNDYYGNLLNSHQSEIMRMYYDCDMSLAEIAQELEITRQGVREVILRSTKKLQQFENKLGLVKKVKSIAQNLQKIIDKTEESEASKDLKDLLNRIKEL